MPAFPTTATVAMLSAILLSGCFSGDSEAAPMTLIVEAYDHDNDGAAEVILDLYFVRDDQQGVKLDAKGDLHLAAGPGDAHHERVEYEPIGAVRFEIHQDDKNWIDTKEHGAIYRHVMNDHHFESATSYLLSLELHDGSARYASKAEVYYP